MKKMKRKLLKRLSKLKEVCLQKVMKMKKMVLDLPNKLMEVYNFVKSIVLGVAFAFSIIALSFAANKFHVKYLEYHVGGNTVYIEAAADSDHRGSGTGFQVIAPSGKIYTMTNAHICSMANKKGVIMIQDKKNSGRMLPKRVIEVYPEHDLCIVEGLEGYSGLSLGSDLEVSEPVYALGYPLGEAMHYSEGRVKEFSTVTLIKENPDPKTCTGKGESVQEILWFIFVVKVCVKEFDSVQTSMVIYPGNSGSPMVNMFGNVVGVVFAGNTRTNWASAVPLSYVKELLKGY